MPDGGTYSLTGHANRKNQEWIAELVKRLDKRRPQVLIDVTLVEITGSEAFEAHEREFRDYQNWPGLKSQPVAPANVLEAQ